MQQPTTDYIYAAFELLIGSRTPHGYPVTVFASPAGEGEAYCTLNIDEELQDALSVLEQGDVDDAYLTEFGAFLFNELFSGEVATLYRTSLGITRSQAQQLRIRLRITPPELAALPWEYVHDPHEESFLAISSATALVRYVPINLPVRPTRVNPPLRILAVIANPRDSQSFDFVQERAILHNALAEWTEQGQVQLEVLEQATPAAITQAMRQFLPHVFHFVGHGLFDQGEAHVVLEDEHGGGNLVDERAFREFFTGSQETRLAVLNACQSATLSSSQPLAGLAPRLLQRQLSAVVAMQHPISAKAALVFSREFYRSIALGFPVDAAISEARKGIFLELGAQSPNWGTPVLFLRAKDGQLFSVDRPQKTASQLPDPPEPAKPPVIADFVGRNQELTYYTNKLQATGLAVIAGMAGIGKTALAARLAQTFATPSRTFWHTFREGEGVEVIIWQLSAFLARQHRSELWQMLQATSQGGGKLPPPEVLFDYLFQLIRQQSYLLCFDDFHRVDDDPLLETLVERLRPAVQAGEVRIIITSRRFPNFVETTQFEPLAGLGLADTQAMLDARGCHLNPGLLEALHARTEGNAELLSLTIDAIRQSGNPSRLVDNLMETSNIERYLLNEVDRGLQDEERQVMNGVAALLGYPGTRAVIEEVLGGVNARRQLAYLTNRYLLHQQEGGQDREYAQHAIVQAFYYDLLSRRQRLQMHRLAARYYEAIDGDVLKAALHYERAEEFVAAAMLATQDVYGLINRAQAIPLNSLLHRLTAKVLAGKLWANVLLARGQVQSVLGAHQEAQQAYRDALETLDQLAPTEDIQLLKAHVCHDLGDLLQYAAPQEAQSWLVRGQAELAKLHEPAAPEAQHQQAALLIKTASVQIALNDYTAAERAIEEGLALLSDRPDSLRCGAYVNLGVLCYYKGDMPACILWTERALAICRQLHDYYRSLTLLGNLSIFKFVGGDWSGGQDDCYQALALAEEMGSLLHRVRFQINLAVNCLKMGEPDEAATHLHRAHELAQNHGLREYEMIAQVNIADVYLALGQFEMAQPALTQAEQIAAEMQAQWQMPEIHRLWARLRQVFGQSTEASEHIERAIEIAHRLNLESEEGASLRIQGELRCANGQLLEAARSFEQSYALLQAIDRYEAARTQSAWAQLDALCGRSGSANEKLARARAVFAQLGAKADLRQLDIVLSKLSSV